MNKERKTLTKKDVTKAMWKWLFFVQSNYNYERLQATGVIYSMSHIIKKLYGDDPEAYKACLQRHMQFYNTEPQFGGMINAMVIAMEEERANGAPISDDAINGIKTGLMGPFAGIGDTLRQGTLTPILLGFGVSLGSQGNLMGPLLYAVLMLGIMWGLAYFLWMRGYNMGKKGLEAIMGGSLMKQIITGASAMGAMVLGALSASFVSVSSPLEIRVGSVKMGLQADILDKIFVGLLPLLVTLGTLYLLKNKKMKSTTVMVILMLIGLVGGIIGLL